MVQSAKPKEIAELEWNRVTSLAWPTLSVIYGLQALSAQTPIVDWQILYFCGLFISLLISYIFKKTNLIKFSNTPNVLYLLLSPILIGDSSTNSWMSIGLVTFAAAIYYSTISNVYLAVLMVTGISVFQSLIVQFDFPSISDNHDIQYFYTYFSFLWTFVMGIASVLIRRQYLRTAKNIENLVESKMNLARSQLENLKNVNEKDSRNLRLHGTVLNSLIYIRNLILEKKNFDNSRVSLIAEINLLSKEKKVFDPRNFEEKLQELIDSRMLNKIKISHSSFRGRIESEQLEKSILEIVRELLLNAEKHTKAKNIELSVTKNNVQGIRISLTDDSLMSMSRDEKRRDLLAPFESKNLTKLLNSSRASMHISKSNKGKKRKIEVMVPFMDIQLELEETLARARLSGLNDFALNFLRAGALVTALSLPGYFITGLEKDTLAFVTCTAVLFYVVLQIKRNAFTIFLLSLTSSLIIPSLSNNVSTCSQISSIPWLFNHALIVGFMALIFVKNRFFKCLPILILTFESLYLPTFYPAPCKNIFLGSLPGIPLIIILALAVLGVRRREINFDKNEAFEVSRVDRTRNITTDYREQAFSMLIKDLDKLSEPLKSENDSQRLHDIVTLQIEKIQTFLICSEHFDSIFIQSLFELFTQKQGLGIRGRISLFGTNFTNLDDSIDIGMLIAEVDRIKGALPLHLTVMNTNSLELHFQGPASEYQPEHVQGVPIFYNP